jgi:hypothetical protein
VQLVHKGVVRKKNSRVLSRAFIRTAGYSKHFAKRVFIRDLIMEPNIFTIVSGAIAGGVMSFAMGMYFNTLINIVKNMY